MQPTVPRRQRPVLLGLAVLTVSGLAVASAVSLAVDANNQLAAGTSTTSSCQPAQTPIVITWEPVFRAGGFVVDRVNLGDVDAACAGSPFQLVVSDDGGAELARSTTDALAGGTVVALLDADVPADSVSAVSLVISG